MGFPFQSGTTPYSSVSLLIWGLFFHTSVFSLLVVGRVSDNGLRFELLRRFPFTRCRVSVVVHFYLIVVGNNAALRAVSFVRDFHGGSCRVAYPMLGGAFKGYGGGLAPFSAFPYQSTHLGVRLVFSYGVFRGLQYYPFYLVNLVRVLLSFQVKSVVGAPYRVKRLALSSG